MRNDIPALSLRQPWAWAVLSAGKTIENRVWATGYRGRILIHAAKTYDSDGADWLRRAGVDCPGLLAARNQGLLGAYVGEVTVVDCCLFSPCLGHDHGAWPFGPICWILEDPMTYPEPVPGRGYMGLYDPRTGTAWPKAGRR